MCEIGAIQHTGLTVSDLDRSLHFYCDVIGCTLIVRQEKSGGYLADIVGYPGASVRMAHIRDPASRHVIELFEFTAPEMLDAELEPRRIGNAHLCFLVADLASVHKRLRAAGVHFVSGPVPIDTGYNAGGSGLYLRDPDGITLELFQPAPGTPAALLLAAGSHS